MTQHHRRQQGEQWFVVYAKQGQERLAETHLNRQGYHTYLPRIAVQRRHARKTMAVTVPMFPRYLFVRVDLERMPWRAIYSTVGVVSLVSFGPRPSSVPDAVIDEIRQREGEDGLVRLPPAAAFQPGEAVEMADGPMRDLKALFTVPSEKQRVVVLMSLLGRQVPVHVSPDNLRRAS